MAKRINSVCEQVTEIKNKRKKINSINKVINNEHKKHGCKNTEQNTEVALGSQPIVY